MNKSSHSSSSSSTELTEDEKSVIWVREDAYYNEWGQFSKDKIPEKYVLICQAHWRKTPLHKLDATTPALLVVDSSFDERDVKLQNIDMEQLQIVKIARDRKEGIVALVCPDAHGKDYILVQRNARIISLKDSTVHGLDKSNKIQAFPCDIMKEPNPKYIGKKRTLEESQSEEKQGEQYESVKKRKKVIGEEGGEEVIEDIHESKETKQAWEEGKKKGKVSQFQNTTINLNVQNHGFIWGRLFGPLFPDTN